MWCVKDAVLEEVQPEGKGSLLVGVAGRGARRPKGSVLTLLQQKSESMDASVASSFATLLLSYEHDQWDRAFDMRYICS